MYPDDDNPAQDAGAQDFEMISTPVQLDNKFITPAAPKINHLRRLAPQQITRDIVLANLNYADELTIKAALEALSLVDNLESITREDFSPLRNFLATIVHSVANVSRGRDGMTAQLFKTQRVEQITGQYPVGYKSNQRPVASLDVVKKFRKYIGGR